MPRPRRRPRPPGAIEVSCTGRGAHERRLLCPLQLTHDGERFIVTWNPERKPSPLAARRPDGDQTLVFKCPDCPRELKRGNWDIAQIAITLGREQGIKSDENTPAEVDISVIDRA